MTRKVNSVRIIKFDEKYRDDMIFMILQAKDSLGRIPKLNEDLLNIKERYFDKGDMFWIALGDSDRVIGCISTNTNTESSIIWLKRLYIKASLKRKGIGSELLKCAEDFAMEKKIYNIKVHIGGKKYFESYSFYPKHGYKDVEESYMEKILHS